jgi:hypothetical protein
MSAPETQKPAAGRDALNESERAAAREQPESYKPDETADKVVEIAPIDGDGAPIKGLDPKS